MSEATMLFRAGRILLLDCLLTLFISGCSVLSPTQTPTLISAPPPGNCPVLERGLAFLEARYNPELRLLNEAPTAAPRTFWLTNDNVLAAYAFERLGQTDLSAKLHDSLRRYGRESNGLIEVLWGAAVDYPPYTSRKEKVAQIGENEILAEIHDSGGRFEDWADYADLGFYDALNQYHRGHSAQALGSFNRTLALFDGTGFHDKAFNGQYETYKLALSLYAGAELQAALPNRELLRGTLEALQSSNGGFATHYLDPRTPQGDTNTETTSLALLALQDECAGAPTLPARDE